MVPFQEAFHRVYQAFETLSDAKARQKYDQLRRMGQLGVSVSKVPAKATPNCGEKAKSAGPCFAQSKSGGSSAGGVQQAAEYKARLMTKIHALLKQMPRDVRYKVISKEFSEKQLVLLQEWMVDFAERESVPIDPQRAPQQATTNTGQKRCKTKPKTSRRAISGTRGVVSNGGCYMASVCWDGIQINSRCCDLATALEYLVILTSSQHKMQEDAQWQGAFAEHLEQTLRSSAEEHGRTLEEIKVRFRTYLTAGMFIGRDQVHSPVVHTYEDLQELRHCMEPVRAFRKISGGNFFKSISPSEFQDYWQQFQAVVAGMFQVAGRDTKQSLLRIRTWYDARRHVRAKYLQQWERHFMSREDKKKNVPLHIRCLSKQYKKWRNPLADNLRALKPLLVRWQNILQKEAQDLEKQRRQVVQQRKREREAQREARWKRMHDPHLTMDDILGPPKHPAEPDKRLWFLHCSLGPALRIYPTHVQLLWQTAYGNWFAGLHMMEFKSITQIALKNKNYCSFLSCSVPSVPSVRRLCFLQVG